MCCRKREECLCRRVHGLDLEEKKHTRNVLDWFYYFTTNSKERKYTKIKGTDQITSNSTLNENIISEESVNGGCTIYSFISVIHAFPVLSCTLCILFLLYLKHSLLLLLLV